MKNTITRAGAALVLAVAVGLAGCGGGGGGGSTTPVAPGPAPGGGISGTGSPLSASGTITVGATALSINGIAVATSATTVVKVDDNPKTVGEVKDGMTGKVRGRVSDDGLTGTADTIEIENEVRGLVQARRRQASSRSGSR